MERRYWSQFVDAKTVLGWRCPRCNVGHLEAEAEGWREEDVKESGGADCDWEPDWVRNLWTGSLRCRSSSCGDVVVGMGYTSLDQEVDEEVGLIWVSRYHPLLFEPPLHIVALPKSIPALLETDLIEVFRLYWASPSAAANRLRVAIEHYLSLQKVPRSRRTKKGKLVTLPLHTRIERFKQARRTNADVADHLLALKWLGNEGTHDGTLTHDDVLDGLVILEEALRHISGNASASKALTMSVNKNRGTGRKKR